MRCCGQYSLCRGCPKAAAHRAMLKRLEAGMSRKNILKTESLGDSKVHVTFETSDGIRKYEYIGSSARAIKRGKTDPSQLVGRLIEHRKAD